MGQVTQFLLTIAVNPDEQKANILNWYSFKNAKEYWNTDIYLFGVEIKRPKTALHGGAKTSVNGRTDR